MQALTRMHRLQDAINTLKGLPERNRILRAQCRHHNLQPTAQKLLLELNKGDMLMHGNLDANFDVVLMIMPSQFKPAPGMDTATFVSSVFPTCLLFPKEISIFKPRS